MPPWQYTAEVADEACSHDAKVMLMSDHGWAQEEPESSLCLLVCPALLCFCLGPSRCP